jgi:predicted nucleotidyltransferase
MTDQSFAIEVNRDAIEAFCRKWGIRQFSLFGSVLNAGEFRADSDVDVLVVFEEGERDWGPWLSRWDEMVSELGTILGRKADIVEKKVVVNPFIRHSILTTHRLVYAA